jgi:hypothetical protein
MSSNDSSTLIDAPAASKLGENRALYYSEEENRIEKFRPYGIPEPEWLDKVKQGFDARPGSVQAREANRQQNKTAAETAPAPGPGNGAAGEDNGPSPLTERHAPVGDEAELADPKIEAL